MQKKLIFFDFKKDKQSPFHKLMIPCQPRLIKTINGERVYANYVPLKNYINRTYKPNGRNGRLRTLKPKIAERYIVTVFLETQNDAKR